MHNKPYDFWQVKHEKPPNDAEWPMPEKYVRLGCKKVEQVTGFNKHDKEETLVIIECPDREASVNKKSRKTRSEIRY